MSEQRYQRGQLPDLIQGLMKAASARKSQMDRSGSDTFIAQHPWAQKFLSVGHSEADGLWEIAGDPGMRIEQVPATRDDYVSIRVFVPDKKGLSQTFLFKRIEGEESFISLRS